MLLNNCPPPYLISLLGWSHLHLKFDMSLKELSKFSAKLFRLGKWQHHLPRSSGCRTGNHPWALRWPQCSHAVHRQSCAHNTSLICFLLSISTSTNPNFLDYCDCPPNLFYSGPSTIHFSQQQKLPFKISSAVRINFLPKTHRWLHNMCRTKSQLLPPSPCGTGPHLLVSIHLLPFLFPHYAPEMSSHIPSCSS